MTPASTIQHHGTQAEAALQLAHGSVRLPAFLPDATLGTVRSVDATDLTRCKIQAVVMNTFHLTQRPGSSTVQALGGLHEMSGWRGPIFTDSGGFQAYSIIRQNPKNGQLTDRGITYRPDGSGRKFHLTPEKAIQLQLSYGADVVFCLDDCTHVSEAADVQLASVERTIAWARRSKREFCRLLEQKSIPQSKRPLLFAVIQGGRSRELRTRCAEELLMMGFDGFGYGGWPLDDGGNLVADMLALTRELVPREAPIHALGVGHPDNIVTCARMGYDLFDSAMPTRDARHGRLCVFTRDPATEGLADGWFRYIYAQDKKHIKVKNPLSSFCDCLCCTNYSLGYLHHLYKVGDSSYKRLATVHNLRFVTTLMDNLRSQRGNA